MSTTVIVVVDGLGIGAMPDAGELRPGDRAADTLGHVLDHLGGTRAAPALPSFGALGLGLLHPHPLLARRAALPAAVARAALGYPGADTYAGHQTMMGADFSRVTLALLAERLEEVCQALKEAGHTVGPLGGEPLLAVDGHVLVHDNLEADPGVNWNVSADLGDASFEEILGIARTVRAVAPVARVIAVGGRADGPLPDYVRRGDGATVGLDTPASGFYRNGGLRVRHMGAPLDHTRQLPELTARAGLPVTLVGKAADILACDAATRRPAVPTGEVLAHTLDAVRDAARDNGARDDAARGGAARDDGARGGAARGVVRRGGGEAPHPDADTGPPGTGALIVANVQESDLAGHQQDPARYGAVLEEVDAGLGALISQLGRPGDRLIVTGDHGNDPAIGHAHHTREYVPVLIHRPEAVGPRVLGDAAGLADVGASAARALGLDPGALAAGTPLDA
jgi:phosphopentomutase